MKKEITLQDVTNSIESTKQEVIKLIEATNKSVELLAGAMNREFGKVYQEFGEVRKEFGKVHQEIERLDKKIDGVEDKLGNKIESEIDNLAAITKREFDEVGACFNRMDNEFKEVHEELKQVNGNVIGLDRRVTKLENVKTRI